MTEEIVDMCNFTSDIEFEGTYANGLIKAKYEYFEDCTDEVIKIELPNNQAIGGSFVYPKTILSGLSFGTYTFTFTDDTGDSVVKTIEVGKNRVKSSISVNNFEFRTTNKSKCTIVSNGRQLECGYITIDLLSCYDSNEGKMKVLDWDVYKNSLILVETSTGDYFGDGSVLPICLKKNEEGNNGSQVTCSVIGENGRLYVWKSDATYNIYLKSIENGCNGYTFLGSVFVEGIDKYDLFLGSKLLPYSTELVNYSGEWWRTIRDDFSSIKNWAKRYALYNRNDFINESFTNKVFAINVKDKVVDTALFGSPENTNRYLKEVYYENDEYNSSYSLSEDSVIPTTLNTGKTITKPLFGEMAINGNLIISDKIGTFTLNENDFHLGGEGSRNYFTCGMSNSKVLDKHGCLAKLEDGRILYTVKDGNKFYFDDDLPEFDGTPINISFYPIFYYPIIYRPFYAKTYFMDLVNAGIRQDGSGNLNLGFSGQSFTSTFEIHNGLTYQKKFGKVNISCGSADFNALSNFKRNIFNFDTTGTETCDKIVIPDNDVVEVVTDTNYNYDEKDIEMDNEYSYEISENAPGKTEIGYDKLIDPYKIELNTIEDQTTIHFTNSIRYRIDVSEKRIRFYDESDITTPSRNVDYFLVKKTNQHGFVFPDGSICEPLTENGYVYVQNDGNTKLYHLACVYGPFSDKHLDAVYENGDGNEIQKFVNKPGTFLFVDVEKRKMKVPYYKSNTTTEKSSKTIPSFMELLFGNHNYIDNLKNFERDSEGKLILSDILIGDGSNYGYDIRPLINYKLDTIKTSQEWYSLMTSDLVKRIEIFDEDPLYIGEEDGVVVNEENRTLVWKNIDDFYVIGIEKFGENEQRNNQYEKAVNGMGSTTLIRFYKQFIQLESYDSGADEPYLKIEPDKENGIYTPIE